MSRQELFDEADRLEQGGNETAALQIWRTLAEVHPDPISLCRLASMAEDLGEIDEAERTYWHVISTDPGFRAAYIGLASMTIDQGQYMP